jgi:hypothetical protein
MNSHKARMQLAKTQGSVETGKVNDIKVLLNYIYQFYTKMPGQSSAKGFSALPISFDEIH